MPSILKLADPSVPVETAITGLRLSGPVRVAALFSGGKDSTYAAYVASQRGWDVTPPLDPPPRPRLYALPHAESAHDADSGGGDGAPSRPENRASRGTG